MAGRGFGSGFPRWRGGRGSGDFDMWQTRGGFSGPGWGPRSPRRGGAPRGYGFGFRQDSFSGGGGGRNGGQNKLPSLLAHRIYPWEPQHGSQDYEWQFGGGRRPNRQRNRKKPLKQDGQNKRKQSESATDEPDSKMGRTEAAEDRTDDDPGEEQETSAAASEAAEGKSSVLSVKEELAQLKKKLQEKQAPASANDAADQSEESEQAGTSARAEAEGLSGGEEGKSAHPDSKAKKIRGFFEMSGVKITARRISFACSVCKFRSFYSEDMTTHLESRFHKDIFKYLTIRLDKRTTDFLQEYLKVKHKNMEKTVSRIPNHEAAICQLYKEQDMTREIGMEHFIRKVEAAHCSVCNLYIPMQHSLVQRHLRSPDHNYNRKCMMEECKKTALTVARSILNHKPVRDKLEKFMKGENPFTGDPDDHDLEDSMAAEAPEADRAEDDGQGEKQEGVEATAGVEETAGEDSFAAEEASEKQQQEEQQQQQEVQEEEKHEDEKPEAEGSSEEGKGAEEMEGEQNVEKEEEEKEEIMEEEDLQTAE